MGHIIKPEWKNPTRGVQTKDVIKNYFTQLSKTQIDELYEMFRYVRIETVASNLHTFRYFSSNDKINDCVCDTYTIVKHTHTQD